MNDYRKRRRRPGATQGRPADPQGRPGGAESRPGGAESRPGAAESRPGAAEGRLAGAQGRPGAQGRSSSAQGRRSAGAASGGPGRRRPADPRRTAYDVLAAVRDREAYANLLLPRLLAERGLAGRDAALATELAYGTLRGQGSYDAVLAACSDRPLRKLDPPVLDVLRLGTHQLLSTRIGAHAAVATSVDLAKSVAGPRVAGYVNAVLRRVATRDLPAWLDIVAPDPAADQDGYLATRYSHPRWIIAAYRDALGPAATQPAPPRTPAPFDAPADTPGQAVTGGEAEPPRAEEAPAAEATGPAQTEAEPTEAATSPTRAQAEPTGAATGTARAEAKRVSEAAGPDEAQAESAGAATAPVRSQAESTGAATEAGQAEPEQAGAVTGPAGEDAELTGQEAEATAAEAVTELEAALAAGNVRPRVTLATFPPGPPRADVMPTGAVPGRWSPYAFTLPSGDPAALVESGAAAVQDEGSQLAALALSQVLVTPQAGRRPGGRERWLDLCAGPGGKSRLLYGLAADRGATLVAAELHPHRAALVRDALVCAGPAGDARYEVVVADGTRPAWPDGAFDRVLVDAPCSGLGALRRRPEARWRKSEADLKELTAIQRDLLRAALAAVRPGGVVAYVTCSPVPAETTEVVTDVAAATPGTGILDAPAALPGVPGTSAPDPRFAQLWPHRHGTDAIFIALLRRKG